MAGGLGFWPKTGWGLPPPPQTRGVGLLLKCCKALWSHLKALWSLFTILCHNKWIKRALKNDSVVFSVVLKNQGKSKIIRENSGKTQGKWFAQIGTNPVPYHGWQIILPVKIHYYNVFLPIIGICVKKSRPPPLENCHLFEKSRPQQMLLKCSYLSDVMKRTVLVQNPWWFSMVLSSSLCYCYGLHAVFMLSSRSGSFLFYFVAPYSWKTCRYGIKFVIGKK